jgi:hypothetical protein
MDDLVLIEVYLNSDVSPVATILSTWETGGNSKLSISIRQGFLDRVQGEHWRLAAAHVSVVAG